MTPEMKVCFAVQKNMFAVVLLRERRNKIHFCFDLWIYYLCFDEIMAGADASF